MKIEVGDLKEVGQDIHCWNGFEWILYQKDLSLLEFSLFFHPLTKSEMLAQIRMAISRGEPLHKRVLILLSELEKSLEEK